jgi:quercetin dioxygenase-like cupin family protein
VPYAIVDSEDVEPAYGGVFKQIRQRLGLNAFGINQVDLPPGAEGREHDHSDSGQEEVYLVLAGTGTMTIDGEDVDLKPGRYVFVAAASVRKPVAGPEGLSWVVVGAPPQDGWEPQL